MKINQDTLLYGSFAQKAGSKGCKLFNTCFDYYQLNAIYKSFSVDNIKQAVEAARTLDIKGFAGRGEKRNYLTAKGTGCLWSGVKHLLMGKSLINGE